MKEQRETGPVKFNPSPIVKSLNREIKSNYPSMGKIFLSLKEKHVLKKRSCDLRTDGRTEAQT